jgi:hypothetical protein
VDGEQLSDGFESPIQKKTRKQNKVIESSGEKSGKPANVTSVAFI